MIKFYVSFLFLVLSLSAKADGCADCAQLKALEAKFNKYDYGNTDDRTQAAADIPAVEGFVQKFARVGGANKNLEFQALVRTIAAALPFDVETNLAAGLSELLTDTSLKATYASTLNGINDICRRNFLSSSVEEHRCVDGQRQDDTFEKPTPTNKSCTQQIDFDACLIKKR